MSGHDGDHGPGPPEPRREPPTPEEGGELFDEITGARTGFDWRSSVLVPGLAVVSALLVGGVFIALGDLDTLRLWGRDPVDALGTTIERVMEGYVALFEGAVGGVGPLSETLIRAGPLILAGLGVAVGFQAGLFNIGANGQMLLGGMFALTVGFAVDLPMLLHLPLAVLAGFVGGALWGAIPGWLRARTGAHEVITTIMLNFVALRLVDWMLTTDVYQVEGRNDPVSHTVAGSARYPSLLEWLDPRHRVHLGIVVAVLAAVLVWWLLYRSTFGFELRTVGASPEGARYAGMSVVTLYIAVMALAGGLAGLGGTDLVLGHLGRATSGFVGATGFDAIALALLGRSHPLGVVAAGLLFGGLAAGGQAMQAATDVGVDIVQVIQALIIVFIAAPALIRALYRVRTDRESTRLTKGWTT